MADPIDVILGFFAGIVTGVAIQYLQLKHSLKIEKTKRLSPYLESASPILDEITHDSTYAANVQLRDDEEEFERVLKRVSVSIAEYAKWFNDFRIDGMIPELNSLDADLLSRFVGMFTHATLCRLHGQEYLSQHVGEIAKYCTECKLMLETRLSD